jgi:hypothetical protein
MDILIAVVISGMAVAFTTELIASIVETMFSPRIVKLILTAPLSFVACWFLDVVGFQLIVASLAAAFFSTVTLHLINKPVSIQSLPRR